MCLETCTRPEVRQCQIQTAVMVWSNFKSNPLYHHWSGSIIVRSCVITLKKQQLFSPPTRLTVSTSLGSSHKSWSWFRTFAHILLVNEASLASKNGEHAFSSRRLSLKFLISGSSRMMIVTGFSLLGPSDAPNSHHLWQCCSENKYPNFCSQWVVTDMLPVLFTSFQS